ncbi:MAG: DUF488 family protein [Anaerolineae bacterium]|jgi:uncharacterized protein (DUF488 family)|nr:DUF488 domain-containing protein [Chloroflexota bacterium]
MQLYTIGSSGWSAQQFFTALQRAGVRRILDIRQGGATLLSGFAIKRDLPYLARAVAQIDYLLLLDLAPAAELFRAYRRHTISNAQYLQAYRQQVLDSNIIDRLEATTVDGGVLLCSEREPDTCHRRVAADLLVRRWPELQVTHLTPTPARALMV